ncbi:D-tyrosyl-tRNA(Tyr) deacylase [Macrococcus hajekii]|uniref:D-aminoacyl-tRNA deacylase n=1 Tax=Macrococcus hajekii TaxID=198482 RepID=A0A4R6BLY5_9STAP|nr:D-aminoacyl-tRNA deacylase [Macrococcus hajekii]TDM02824.1 D-tyrosyl-tRNA(Tyr) deacylase [Macrococcus hajekii]GGB04188.1 D-aminoacyl-tRNA deacylase [Macrococcus hajekii]
MRVVVQRVSRASVTTDQRCESIEQGFMLLVGIGEETTEADLKVMAKKISAARLFEDAEGKMNLAIKDIEGSILSISQFTLYGDVRKGNRPSFTTAKEPKQAAAMYEQFNTLLREEGITVKTGVFGADMAVELVNDGPVTLVYDSREGKIQ